MKGNTFIKVKHSHIKRGFIGFISAITIINFSLLISHVVDNEINWSKMDTILTFILSLLLIIQGFFFFYRQNKDKKEVSLRDEKMQLHQERLNVYIEYSNVLAIVCNINCLLDAMIDSGEVWEQRVELVHNQMNELYASQRKSILLFSNDTELIDYLSEIYMDFNTYYRVTIALKYNISRLSEEIKQEKEIDLTQFTTNLKMNEATFKFLRSNKYSAELLLLSDRLKDELESDKFIDMFSKYLAPESKIVEENNIDK